MDNNVRLEYLLWYLKELKDLNEAGFRCNKEIGEVIEEIRKTLMLE